MSSSNKNNNNNLNKHHSRSRSRERENSDNSYHRHRRDSSSPSRHHHRYHDNIKIYISNLSSTVSQHKIKDEFNKYGNVYDLVLKKKKMVKVQIILALLLCQKKQTLNMQ